jgi:hypothetical protein
MESPFILYNRVLMVYQSDYIVSERMIIFAGRVNCN